MVPVRDIDSSKDVLLKCSGAHVAGPCDFNGLLVLVAEDDRLTLAMTRIMLEGVGLTVHAAADGAEAIQLAESGTYALILMDIQMPEIGGIEAARRIRQMPSHRRTPIIALTAAPSIEAEARCAEAGMDDYLSKPVRAERLLATVSWWLRHE